MPIKLIIFDLDGTLVDTVQDITNALNYGMGSYGLKELTVRETVEMVGEGITRLVEKALPAEKQLLRDNVIQRFLEYYSEHLTENSREYPHVKETLKNLNNFKKAVLSNKREDLSERLLKELDFAGYFDIIIGSDTTEERKPSAIPVLYVMSRLSVRPEESIIVGDSNFDIEAGKNAGIKTVAVTYGYRPREFLSDADYMIDDIRELLPLLQKI
ncbi:MAG: HAD-IIIA family hydrolase [Nitrospira sp.]|nr:HAD-IIIA family hydrolase [Nitrospira sp.]